MCMVVVVSTVSWLMGPWRVAPRNSASGEEDQTANVARDKVADIYGVRGEILFHSDKHMYRKRELPHYSAVYTANGQSAPKSVI